MGVNHELREYKALYFFLLSHRYSPMARSVLIHTHTSTRERTQVSDAETSSRIP